MLLLFRAIRLYIHVLKEIFLEFSPEKLLDKIVDFFIFAGSF